MNISKVYVYSFFLDLRILNWQLRVDITGVETQIVFDKVLANLAKSAPPIPGFRRQKGGNRLMLKLHCQNFNLPS